MKGREIEDQVKLAKFLLNYAEVAEEDEVIIALDQEKAYDRINHDYLISYVYCVTCDSRRDFTIRLQTYIQMQKLW
jgi:hypothetical protein